MAYKRDHRKITGQKGEAAAQQYLRSQRFTILTCNWRCRYGEIDIIAQDGHTIVFIEVRTRKNNAHFGSPLESITTRKRHKIRTLSQIYLKQHQQFHHPIRFDVITVLLDERHEVKQLDHIRAAF